MRPWPFEHDVAHLVFYAKAAPPDRAQIQQWLADIAALGYTSVRTGALATNTAELVDQLGFHCVQRLVLLEHTDPARVGERNMRRATPPTHRLLAAQHRAVSDIDQAAFGTPWGLDTASIVDVCAATPHHRARVAGERLSPAAYMIAGRDGRHGFLQRLAVAPEHQRSGRGRALVIDAMRWLARWHVDRVLVNTHEHNTAAQALYHQLGFTDLAEHLAVFERDLP